MAAITGGASSTLISRLGFWARLCAIVQLGRSAAAAYLPKTPSAATEILLASVDKVALCDQQHRRTIHMWPSIIFISIVTTIILIWVIRTRVSATAGMEPEREFDLLVSTIAQQRVPELRRLHINEVAALFWAASGIAQDSLPDPQRRPLEMPKIDPIIENIRTLLPRLGEIDPQVMIADRRLALDAALELSTRMLEAQLGTHSSAASADGFARLRRCSDPFVLGYIFGQGVGAGAYAGGDRISAIACGVTLMRGVFGSNAVSRHFTTLQFAEDGTEEFKGRNLAILEGVAFAHSERTPTGLVHWFHSQRTQTSPQ